jgi:hypothetical protein
VRYAGPRTRRTDCARDHPSPQARAFPRLHRHHGGWLRSHVSENSDPLYSNRRVFSGVTAIDGHFTPSILNVYPPLFSKVTVASELVHHTVTYESAFLASGRLLEYQHLSPTEALCEKISRPCPNRLMLPLAALYRLLRQRGSMIVSDQ